ncbi:MAG: hypothetical protein FJY85_18035, partial [Deltaproteobacteria bacterium]|nr:hypothetical protein [Deltaproteobacteria bacterium]
MATSMNLVLIVISYLIVIIITFVLVKMADRDRLPKLRRAAAHIEEGHFPEGGNMLLWDPGSRRFTMTITGVTASILFCLYLWWGQVGNSPEPVAYAILSSSLVIAIGLIYHFPYYYRTLGRQIILVNDRGIEVAFMKKGELKSGYRFDWNEIEDVFLNQGLGGGTTFSGSDNGIMIKAPTRLIFVERHLKNANQLYAWLVTRFPREFFSYAVFDYLSYYF